MTKICSPALAAMLSLLCLPCWARPDGGPPQQEIGTYDSVMNLRDVGGKRTRDGSCVKRGLAFRSAHFAGTSGADGAALAQALGLRVYYDMRSPGEIANVGGASALVRAGVQWQRIPIDCTDDPFIRSRETRVNAGWSAFYLRVFAQHGSDFVAVLRGLAEGEVPAVYSCSLGKDRTGIATALFLAALGVDIPTIVDDYHATTAALLPHIDRFAPFWAYAQISRETFVKSAMAADPEIMRGFLAGLHATYGTVEAALRAHGMASSTLEALRRRYLYDTTGDC